MNLAFDPATHAYSADGRLLPSCTEILRAMGIYDGYEFAEPHHRFRGKAVHDCCAVVDLGGRVERVEAPPHLQQVADDIMNGYLPAFAKWKARTGFQGYCWECPLIDPVLGYAGTFDAAGSFADGPELILVDLKSGGMPEMVPVQLAAYVALIRNGQPVNAAHPGWQWVQEMARNGVPIRRVAVRLEKDGRETMFTETKRGVSYDAAQWDAAWRSVLNVYTLKANHGLL